MSGFSSTAFDSNAFSPTAFDIGIQIAIDLDTFGLSVTIKDSIGASITDIGQSLGLSVKIQNTIGTSTKI